MRWFVNHQRSDANSAYQQAKPTKMGEHVTLQGGHFGTTFFIMRD